jgi:hypothetical protein
MATARLLRSPQDGSQCRIDECIRKIPREKVSKSAVNATTNSKKPRVKYSVEAVLMVERSSRLVNAHLSELGEPNHTEGFEITSACHCLSKCLAWPARSTYVSISL